MGRKVLGKVLRLMPLVGLLLTASFAFAGTTELVSVSKEGEQSNANVHLSRISADGRYVVFVSYDSNLVENDTNGFTDILIHDRKTNENNIVSSGADGRQANGPSTWPSISADGRYVSFTSSATNLVDKETNSLYNVFVKNLMTGEIEIISIGINDERANGQSGISSISSSGRYVAFDSMSSNLAPVDLNGPWGWDVFVHDRLTGKTDIVSVDSSGAPAGLGYRSSFPFISADGQYVLFSSNANFGKTDFWNWSQKVYLHDRQNKTTELISINNVGEPANGDSIGYGVSSDGNYVVFISYSDNLDNNINNRFYGNIFYRKRLENKTGRVVLSLDGKDTNGKMRNASMSSDGKYITFVSDSDNLVENDTDQSDVFVLDVGKGYIQKITVDINGSNRSGGFFLDRPSISEDGRFISFVSGADFLVPNDNNRRRDVFVWDRLGGDLDNTPPNVAVDANPNILWPPNKKYVDVLIDGSATDDSGEVSVEITVTDEYGEMVAMPVSGFGSTIQLEAWREGDDPDGRTYTITAVATDAAGNQATATAEAVVPHDMRK